MAGKLVKTHSRRWIDTYTFSSGWGTYNVLTGSSLNFTTSITGGIYLLRCDVQLYTTSSGNGGVDCGFRWNGTNIASTTSSQAWARFGNGSPTTGASNISRMWVHEPNVTAGTSITVEVTGAGYSSNAGQVWFNYPGYNNFSDLYVMEFEPI
jgi:hypothetical protein